MQQKSNSAPGKASAAARYAVIIANPASHRFARGIEELHETVRSLTNLVCQNPSVVVQVQQIISQNGGVGEVGVMGGEDEGNWPLLCQ